MFKKIILDGEETCYSINEQGQVRNDKTGNFLKGSILHSYRYIALRWNGKQKNKSVHRLVAETFIPNPNNLPYVHHKDANRLNNCVENLAWVSEAENRQEAPHPNNYKKYAGKTEIEGEIWRTFRNSVYQVSNFGRVKNVKTNRILKGNKSDCGYIRVDIQLPGEKRRKYMVHQLVYECFISPQYDVINHIDGNKTNNKLENLENVTHQENMQKAAYETNAWHFRKVTQYDLEGNYIQTFPNATAAAKAVNILPSSMRNAIRLREGKTQGFVFKYIEKDEASSTIPEGSRANNPKCIAYENSEDMVKTE
jgi:hypothetical protein